ncbi:MAG: hypothetical protein ACT4O2_07100 [Beijerinckiaceae bacterium]
MPNNLGRTIRTGLTLSLALTSLVAVTIPSHSRDGGEIAKDVLEGIARVINSQPAPAAPSPAPAPAPPQPKIKYVPVYVPYPRHAPRHAPRHCWYEGREVYDGQDYVASKVKVCR